VLASPDSLHYGHAMRSGRGFKIAVGILFPLFILGVLAAAFLARDTWMELFSSRSGVQEWVAQYGVWAPLVYVAVQVFQVVIFVVPGEVVQIAGGYLFGIPLGALYSVVGIAIGSSVDFYMGRLFGRAFVEGVFGEKRVSQFDSLAEKPHARTAFFLLFVIPGIPKDVLVYVAGLSRLRFGAFLLVSVGGRLPGILGSAVIGASAAEGRYVLAGVVFGISVALFVLGVIFRQQLRRLAERWSNRRQ
jgi:uncharacterized membrane protein YdjX (TVP38/TMEM64 family)